MKSKTKIISTFHCSTETAFKMPILGDATKIHTGYGLLPSVSHFADDSTWGKPGGYRMVHVKKNLLYKAGLWAKDIIVERNENKYWKWELNNIEQRPMGFKKMEGEWLVEDNNDGTVLITYTYSLYSANAFIYPFHWLFTKLVWHKYMQHATANISAMIATRSPYMYD
jgi:hypothetical protein